MLTVLVVINFTLAVFAFTWGVRTEYRQSREDNPVAVVATMPFGVASALLGTIGTVLLFGREIPPWIYILQFVVLAALFVFVIKRVSAN